MSLSERLKHYLGATPVIDPTAFVAPQATLIGAVTLGPQSSVWPNCVLRADINSIVIGTGSNLQESTVVHLADDYGVQIGDYVTIGHKAMIHACTIEDECLIGMSATILDGAVIGKGSVVGASALVTKGMQVPPGSVVMGMPGKVVKTLDEDEQADLRLWAQKYIEVAAAHKALLEANDEYTY
jgi:carbonic anhydrase/acetyltransferase-like protein (isoleucine patch superfamily)